MVNSEIADWIKKNKASGHDISELKDYLIKSGYAAKDVDEATRFIVEESKPKQTPIPPLKGKKDNKKGKVLIGVAIAAALLLLISLFLFWPRQYGI